MGVYKKGDKECWYLRLWREREREREREKVKWRNEKLVGPRR